jgi:hypothetical protein
MTRIRELGFATLVMGGLISCGGDPGAPNGHLIDGQKPSKNALVEKIREQHKIRVFFTPQGSDEGEWLVLSQAQVIEAMQSAAGQMKPGQGSNDCATAEVRVNSALWVYEAILDIMDVGAAPYTQRNVEFHDKTTKFEGSLSIPRQPVAVTAVLAEYLSHQNLLFRTQNMFENCNHCDTIGCELPLASNNAAAALALAADINYAYDLTDRMIGVAVKAMTAVSDSTRSSAPPGLGADQLAWTQPILSRSAAAGMLLGGDIAKHGFSGGFCPGLPLTREVRAAADLLRASGVSINDLAESESSLSTDALLHDGSRNGDVTHGSVAMRLALISGSLDLATTTNLPKQYGLTLTDFAEARQYLVAESDAFARDRTVAYAQRLENADKTVSLWRYAAGSLPASATPDAYYAALASDSLMNLDQEERATSLAGATFEATRQLSQLADFVAAHKADFGDESSSGGTTGNAGPVREAVAAGLMKVSSNVTGVLSITKFDQDFREADDLIYKHADADDHRARYLVWGEDALRCAMDGNDGVSECPESDPRMLRLNETVESVYCNDGVNLITGSCFWWMGPLFPAEQIGKRAYIVHQKAGTAGHPGDFDVDLGFVIGTGDYRGIAIPKFQADAAQLIRPSQSWCNMPHQSCAGASFDERLPLEDELTTDTDGVESSWKHYLALARAAASHADSLGQEYVNASLQYDERIEEVDLRAEQRRQQLNSTIETLQDTCGTQLDTDKIAKALFGKLGEECTSGADCGADGALTCSPAGKCQYATKECTEAGRDCATNQSCVGGLCIPDISGLIASHEGEDSDIRRLGDCIGAVVLDFAALGDQPLCVVTEKGNKNLYCPATSATDQLPCPGLAEATGQNSYSCQKYADNLPDYDVIPVGFPSSTNTTLLGLFKVSTATTAAGAGSVCSALAAARRGETFAKWKNATLNVLEYLPLTDGLLPTKITELAKRIGFEAGFGSYGSVTLDEVPILTTGKLGEPAVVAGTSSWPCTDDNTGINTTLQDSHVRCEAKNPDSVTQVVQAAKDRGVINDRLMRGVIALRYLAGITETQGLRLPAYVPVTNKRRSVSRSFEYDPDGKGIGGVTSIPVYESRSGVQGSRDLFYFSDTYSNYVATYTMWAAGSEITPIPMEVKLANGDDYAFAISEFDGGADVSEHVEISDTCCTLFLCDDCSEYGPELHPASLAGWLKGLYRTNTSLLASDAYSEGTGWFRDALTKIRDGVEPRRLPGHIELKAAEERQLGGAFGDVTFSPTTLLDALELACMLDGKSVNNVAVDISKTPSVAGPADFPALQAYMDALAKRIENWAATFVVARVPNDVVDFKRETTKAGAFPKLGGSYATAVTTLRGDLVSLTDVAPLLGEEIRRLGLSLSQAGIAIAQANNNQELAKLQNEANTIQHITQCVAAATNSASIDPVHAMGGSMAAAAQCLASVALTVIGGQMLELQNANIALDKQQAIVTLQQAISEHAQALQQYAKRVSEAVESMDGQLAEIERQRNNARRAVAEILRRLSFESSATRGISSGMAAISATAKTRYTNAFDVAKRMAFLARRSIEQRLGISLDELADDLPLVEAPQRWAGTVCERSGIDWETIKSGNSDAPVDYSDSFIGDYVDKLERVVESYRLEHSFHEGSDAAIVSLRDDVLNVRTACDVTVDNLLLHSIDLGATGSSSTIVGTWRPYACNTTTDPDTGEVVPMNNCIVPVKTGDIPYINLFKDLGPAQALSLVYGEDDNYKYSDCDAPNCGYNDNTGWAQRLNLGAGRYRLSWYAQVHNMQICGAPGSETKEEPDVIARVVLEDGLIVPFLKDSQTSSSRVSVATDSGQCWYRNYSLFDLKVATSLDVVLKRSDWSNTIRSDWNVRQGWDEPRVSGVMLEDVSGDSVTATPVGNPPNPFSATTDTRTRRLSVCEDTDGAQFRSKWVRKCVPLCPDGLVATCDPDGATTQCFWEVPFSITQRAIEAGRIFARSGFAQGNFNYRINSIGVNVVGTGVKDCSGSTLPSTCYSSGNLTYSLAHEGPYTVRNHAGREFDAKLFTGHIEHARGLAAERYFTNPISSADQALIDQYMRSELQGRPLDGNFILRIWDDQNSQFGGVEDIQIILKYSYWTRFN